jgi:hypothetical protein
VRSEKGIVRAPRTREALATLAVSTLLTSPFSLLTLHFSLLSAQVPANLSAERTEYARWLASARTSPYAAIAVNPVGAGIRLGPPGSDVPLDGVAEHRVSEQGGRLVLESGGASRPLPRGRPVPIGAYTLVADGLPGRTVVAVFGPVRSSRPPTYFAYDSSLAISVTLEPPRAPGTVRLLAADGAEVEATEAGTVRVPLGGGTTPLRVRRIPGDGDESELEIYFRDSTNARGSYPAGRFVSLTPLPNGRYRLDFNRARNPFCAYSSVYACPVPWPGNGVPGDVRAGERYKQVRGER